MLNAIVFVALAIQGVISTMKIRRRIAYLKAQKATKQETGADEAPPQPTQDGAKGALLDSKAGETPRDAIELFAIAPVAM